MLYDPKILRLHPIGRFAWVGLLLMARGGDPAGTWQARSRQDVPEDLICVLRFDDPMDNEGFMAHISSAVVEWERCGMVTIDDKGLVTVTNWSKRQGDLRPSNQPEQTRERKRLSRMSRDVTTGHAVSRGVTPEERRREESRSETTTPLRSPNGGAPEGFTEFWSNYPRKKAKGDALKAWKTLRPDAVLRSRILAAVEAQRSSRDWSKQGGKFVPYPASWLRGQRWEDTIDDTPTDPDALPPLRLA